MGPVYGFSAGCFLEISQMSADYKTGKKEKILLFEEKKDDVRAGVSVLCASLLVASNDSAQKLAGVPNSRNEQSDGKEDDWTDVLVLCYLLPKDQLECPLVYQTVRK